MAFGPILNYRENFKNKDAKWCMLAVFETIWNLRHTFENKDSKWCILTAFGTADTILKTRTLNGAFLRHSKLFGTAVKKIEIKDNK